MNITFNRQVAIELGLEPAILLGFIYEEIKSSHPEYIMKHNGDKYLPITIEYLINNLPFLNKINIIRSVNILLHNKLIDFKYLSENKFSKVRYFRVLNNI